MHKEIVKFLGCATPDSWVDKVADNLSLLLIDHAHNERKAASTAINLITQYPDETRLLNVLSPIAREEMRHFESVLKIIKMHNVTFGALGAGRYARTLHQYCRQNGKERLIDSLLLAALIEARGCERFFAMQRALPQDIKVFYTRLSQAEARHFQIYLRLAQEISGQTYFPQLVILKKIENGLILQKDKEFRLHSGPPEL